MNCPKCGFVQEERADCKKCGVVFAKFFALRAQESPILPEAQEPLPAPGSPPDERLAGDSNLLLDIRQNLRNLQQRFHELEFERAERRRFRGELRALDMRMQDSLTRVAARQDELEQRAFKLADHPPAPTLQDFAALKMEVRSIDITSIHRRIERTESRLQSLAQELAAKADARLLAFLPVLDERLKEAESRIEALAGANGAALGDDALAQLDSALNSFEDLKSALQSVTIRYSEIGELKKNHLVLRDMVESLQHAAEGTKKEATNGSTGRIIELEKEVSALKAEVRKAYEHMELLELRTPQAPPPAEPALKEEMESLKKDLAAIIGNRAEERQQMQSEVASLGVKVKECLETLAQLPESMESFADQICRIEKQYQPIFPAWDQVSRETSEITRKMIDLGRDYALLQEEFQQTQCRLRALEENLRGLNPPPPDDAEFPLPSEMGSIRKNLDEIRDFMADLSRRL